MNIPLQYFRLVDTIVKEGTLTKAAAGLHLTQSALSHQLKELESELGLPMFYRNGKKLLLSEEGARFLSSADKILTELKLLEADMLHFKSGNTGKIRISTACYTTYHWLPRIIRYYKEVSPGVNVHIVSGATQAPLDFLLRGDLEVAIIRHKIDNAAIHYEPIFRDQLQIIVSRDHPLARKKNITLRDVEGEELFMQAPSTNHLPVIDILLKEHSVTPGHIHRIHYTDAIIEMVDANMGICVLADWIAQPYLDTREIVAFPIPDDIARRTWYAATCRESLHIRNFLKCLKYHFSEMTMKGLSGEPAADAVSSVV